MASRVLRKLQKERERQQAQAHSSDHDDENDRESPMQPKASAFALLGEIETQESNADRAEDDEDDEDSGHRGDGGDDVEKSLNKNDRQMSNNEVREVASPQHQTAAKTRKKKKKKKTKQPVTNESSNQVNDIDAALKSLSASEIQWTHATSETMQADTKRFFKLHSVDTHHLQVGNEMRRLFGKAAVESEHEENVQARHNRRQAQDEQIGLAEAVAGKNSPGGAGLPQMLRRRNIFVQGKEEWPKASGGGLSMEIINRDMHDSVEYAFVHNKVYQGAQKEFDTCVLSMDPNLMVNLLRFNPYHIASLLQVSEIAKQERDHSTSGDLLERALFSFGRAVHSTFAANLAQGKARLDFRRPENREFFLTVWRYITNISMRATWRTAYEWARLLLAMSPVEDPYGMILIIDQLAIRARQFQSLIDLTRHAPRTTVGVEEELSPNLMYSAALASHNLGQDDSQKQLAIAVAKYPWVAASLLNALDVAKIPPSVWGKSPPADSPILVLQHAIYITQALDLWRTTEAKDLLIRASSEKTVIAEVTPLAEDIPMNTARHIILVDKPTLITLLPRDLTSRISSISDPLPPEENIITYITGISDRARPFSAGDPYEMVEHRPLIFINELDELQRIFETLIPGFHERLEGRPDLTIPLTLSDADVSRALQHSNLPPHVLVQLLERLVRLRQVLMEQPDQTVRNPGGGEAVMSERGVVSIHMSQSEEAAMEEGEAEDAIEES